MNREEVINSKKDFLDNIRKQIEYIVAHWNDRRLHIFFVYGEFEDRKMIYHPSPFVFGTTEGLNQIFGSVINQLPTVRSCVQAALGYKKPRIDFMDEELSIIRDEFGDLIRKRPLSDSAKDYLAIINKIQAYEACPEFESVKQFFFNTSNTWNEIKEEQ